MSTLKATETISSAPLTHKPGRSPINRSLTRGIAVLRAFRPGSELLGNAELSERTGIPSATMTRLTQTLVLCGYLVPDPPTRAYRLAPAVLSLAHAMRLGSNILNTAAPLMRRTAMQRHLNVGLAAPDGRDMVYLESFRYATRPSLRSVVSGQRIPMDLTSLGRAYLAALPTQEQRRFLTYFGETRRAELEAAFQSVAAHGFCAASWQPQVVAVGSPITAGPDIYALNLSISTPEPFPFMVRTLSPILLSLREEILCALRAIP